MMTLMKFTTKPHLLNILRLKSITKNKKEALLDDFDFKAILCFYFLTFNFIIVKIYYYYILILASVLILINLEIVKL